MDDHIAMLDGHRRQNGKVAEIAATLTMRTTRQAFGKFHNYWKLITPLTSRCEVLANSSRSEGEVTVLMDGLTIQVSEYPVLDRMSVGDADVWRWSNLVQVSPVCRKTGKKSLNPPRHRKP